MIKSNILKVIDIYRKRANNRKFVKDMEKKIRDADIVVRDLTSEEKSEIDLFWHKFGITPDYSSFRWYYSVNGINDPRYISEGVYTNYIWTVLNDMTRCKGLNDKNYLDLFYNGYHMPETLFHNINGVTLDRNYQRIRFDDAIQLALQEEKIVIKPSVDSCQGNGVICINGEDVINALSGYKKDYIVQRVVEQHISFSVLNDSSVNVVRMTSLLLNEEVIVLDSIIRVGAPGNFTDHKNVAIGINDDGSLKDYGFTVSGKKVSSLANGYVFSGHKLFGYDNMKELVRNLHVKTPQARIIGWDLTVDINGNVVIIEANMDFPGIGRGQDCNGPFFGDYTEEVLNSVFKEVK